MYISFQCTSIEESINYLEQELKALNFLSSKYKDLQMNYDNSFSSKLVNSTYTNLNFIDRGYLVATASIIEKIEFNGIVKEYKIYTIPRELLICRLEFNKETNSYDIAFPKIRTNIKTNKFRPELYKEAKIKIIEFISKNSGRKINDKNLDEQIKNLLIFS